MYNHVENIELHTDEQVKEALAAELVPIIWWFFSVRLLVLSVTYQLAN
jgi:hypothetical protein